MYLFTDRRESDCRAALRWGLMKMDWVITVVQLQSWSMAPKSNKLGLLVLISWTTDRSICHRSKSWSAASRPCGGDQFPVQCQSSRCLVQIVHPRRNHRSRLPVGSAAGSHHIRCSGKHVSFLTTSRVTVQLRNAKITMIKCARN